MDAISPLLMLALAGLLLAIVLAGGAWMARRQRQTEARLARLAPSEAQLRDAIESFPEGIAVFDTEDRLVVCNERYAKLYGAGKHARELAGTPQPVLAQNAMAVEVPPPEYAGRKEQWLKEQIERRRGATGAVRHFQTSDGRWLHGSWVRSRAGGIVSVFTDVSELQRAQDAYVQLAAEEKLVLDTLPVSLGYHHDAIEAPANALLKTTHALCFHCPNPFQRPLRSAGPAIHG